MMIERPVSNVTLAPSERCLSGSEENATLREFSCQACGQHLFSLVLPHYFDGNLCHLVWLPRVVCSGGAHTLVSRVQGEDANLVCRGRAIRDCDISVYLKKYEGASGEK